MKLASGFKIFIFSLNHLALIVLRESGARWYKPTFRTPFYPWIQIFGILSAVGLLFFIGTLAVLGIATGILVGTVWYFVYGREKVSRSSAFQHLWSEAKVLRETESAEQEEEMTDQAPRVIVPIFSDQTETRPLVRLGASFVELGLSEVLRLKEVPEQLHLMDEIETGEQHEATAKDAETVCQELQVALDFNDVVTHNAKQALLHHAQATSAQWLVMAWPKTSEHMRFVRSNGLVAGSSTLRFGGLKRQRFGAIPTNPRARRAGPLRLPRHPCGCSTCKPRRGRNHALSGGSLFLLAGGSPVPLGLPRATWRNDSVRTHEHFVERSDSPIQAIAERSKNSRFDSDGSPSGKGIKNAAVRLYEHRLAEAVQCSVL